MRLLDDGEMSPLDEDVKEAVSLMDEIDGRLMLTAGSQ